MRSRAVFSLCVVAAMCSASFAQVTVDGTRVGDSYGAALAVQTVETGFGDNFSELNAGYGTIDAGRLCFILTGNIEGNFNKLDIFIDSVPGGENTFTANPGNDGVGNMTGFTFDAGFEADYMLIFRRGNDFGNDKADLNFHQLGGGADEYTDIFVGQAFEQEGSASVGPGSVNASVIDVAYDNSNVAGVGGGGGATADQVAAAAVETGFEICIDLADLGNPPGDIKISPFVNNGGHDFAANQWLGGLPDGFGNIGNLTAVDLSTFDGDQFFTVANAAGPVCGDGIVDMSEDCDDGGTDDGDGCAADCTVEDGFACMGEPSMCNDIDECSDMSDNCNPNATCENTVGSFTCTCNAGFTGDGVNCADINECNEGSDNCDANATCNNTQGSFSCSCNPGFEGDGVTCSPVAFCGDGNVDIMDGEQCDDGNNDDGDGCAADCTLEGAAPVPTMSKWGMAGLMALLLGGLFAKFRRKDAIA